MSFVHRHAEMEASGGIDKHSHDTVAEMRECEEQWEAYMAEPPSCPVCDAWGCGGDGNGCRQFEWGTEQSRWESDQDDFRAMMMGAI